MSMRRGRQGPSDPQAIAAARAERQAELRGAELQGERAGRRNPETWGVSAAIVRLPTSADVTIITGARGAIIAANRSDPFDLLHRADGLSDEQHRAARRLFRDYCLRAGVSDRDREDVGKIDGGRADPSDLVSANMVDAGRRIAMAMKGGPLRHGRYGDLGFVGGVGPVNARLLDAIIAPMVDEGAVIAWRGTVLRVTGETDKNIQGGLVRQACQALAMVYREADDLVKQARDADKIEAVHPMDAGNRHAGGSAC